MINLREPMSRRQAARLLGGTSLALVAGGLLTAKPALAGRAWCRLDPHVRIGGKEGHLYVGSYKDDTFDVSTGPIEVLFVHPEGLATELLWTDNGFGHGYDVRFEPDKRLKVRNDGSFNLRIEVMVPASVSNLIVTAEWEEKALGLVTASTKGQTNDRLRFTGKL